MKYDSLAHLKDEKTGKYDLKLHSKKSPKNKAIEKMKEARGRISKSKGYGEK